MKKFTTQEIIQKCMDVHGTLYDYSLTEYKNVNARITIICKTHGPFDQIVSEHLKGRHCPSCAKLNRINTRQQKYGVDFIFQSEEKQQLGEQTILKKYGVKKPLQCVEIKNKQIDTVLNKYGVDNIRKHDITKQSMLHNRNVANLLKHGTIHSSQRHITNILHLLSNPDWLINEYILLDKTATQIAFELGVNETTICNYLRKAEITIKQIYKTSYKATQWLQQIEESNNITLVKEYPIPGTRYKADGYCQETHTIYEFYGDYWHGNPQVFDSSVLNESTNCSMGELYRKTIEREHQVILLGYNLVVMWESEFV